MKKRKMLVLSILSIILLTTLALANDVAYIYRLESKIDQNIINVFSEMGLSTTLISEKNMPANFNSYDLIYVGDDNYRNEESIPVNNYPAVLVNYYNVESWGLTHDIGISQLGATSPLSVQQDGNSIQVYNQAFIKNRVAVPYYYLDKETKSGAMQEVAATQPTSSGKKLGDVISHAPTGSVLTNGKTQQGNLCFFGIAKTDYWTDEAKELFKECVGFVIQSSPSPEIECSSDSDCNDENESTRDMCIYAGTSESFCENLLIEIICLTNEECGTDGFIDSPMCSSEGNIEQNFQTFTCNNPGTEESFCSSTVEPQGIEICSFGCEEGQCLPETIEPACFSNEDCPADEFSEQFCDVGTTYEDDNLYRTITSYTCENPGTEQAECVSQMHKELVEDCSFGCQEAMCLPAPSEGIHDIAITDLTNAVGKIRLERTDSTDILEGEDLTCNEDYRIVIRVDNIGDFTEDVSFLGSINGIDFSHLPIEDFLPEDSPKLKTRTVNFALEEGIYTISIEAIIDGFTDDNPADNIAQREIFVSCPV